nr:N-6 DNA methylase [Helicobacter suis]
MKFGSTLSQDGFKDLKFDFMLTNPPFGKNYGSEKKECENDSRFAVGTTGSGDGQMMFLLNMISKMKDTPLGSRIASIHNGSALFNDDSGQVAIRTHIITKDYLEAIIALPTDLFYNTKIPTFIWILNNRKDSHKKGKVQLIDATSYFEPMAKNLGEKSKRLSQEHINAIFELFSKRPTSPQAVVLDCEDLGYTKFSVFSLKSSQELKNDSKLTHKEATLKRLEELEANPPRVKPILNREAFIKDFNIPIPKKQTPKGEKPAPLNVLFNESKEKIPLKQDKEMYFLEQIRPQMPLSFIGDKSIKVGYEILFNQHFYRHTETKSARIIQQEITQLEGEIQELLDEILA